MIPVEMGQNQSVDPGNSLTEQCFRCKIRRMLIIIAAAIYQISLTLALPDHTLTLTHIQNSQSAGICKGFQSGCRKAQTKAKYSAA